MTQKTHCPICFDYRTDSSSQLAYILIGQHYTNRQTNRQIDRQIDRRWLPTANYYKWTDDTQLQMNFSSAVQGRQRQNSFQSPSKQLVLRSPFSESLTKRKVEKLMMSPFISLPASLSLSFSSSSSFLGPLCGDTLTCPMVVCVLNSI